MKKESVIIAEMIGMAIKRHCLKFPDLHSFEIICAVLKCRKPKPSIPTEMRKTNIKLSR